MPFPVIVLAERADPADALAAAQLGARALVAGVTVRAPHVPAVSRREQRHHVVREAHIDDRARGDRDRCVGKRSESMCSSFFQSGGGGDFDQRGKYKVWESRCK